MGQGARPAPPPGGQASTKGDSETDTYYYKVAPGIYDARVNGGLATLVVNESRELLPRRPTVTKGPVGGEPAHGDAPSLRDLGWVYALAILLLCGEWLLRRRVGLR